MPKHLRLCFIGYEPGSLLLRQIKPPISIVKSSHKALYFSLRRTTLRPKTPILFTPYLSLRRRTTLRPASAPISHLSAYYVTTTVRSLVTNVLHNLSHAIMGKGESMYTFPKLMGSANYKKQSWDMASALQEAELWSRVTRARKMPREIPPPLDMETEKT